jgi:hypothetical protein
MITILFSLGISLSQVSAMAIAKRAANECSVVAGYWKTLTGSTFDVTSPTSCCNDSPNQGIQGVSCTWDGRVTKIDWKDQRLNQNFAEVFGTNLPQDLPLLGTL